MFAGQEAPACNVAVDILRRLQQLLLRDVSFPAAFRARFPCLSCDGYLLALFLSCVSVTGLCVQVRARCDRGRGASRRKAQGCICREVSVSVCVSHSCGRAVGPGAPSLVRCREVLCFPLPSSGLLTSSICLTHYSNLVLYSASL